jgi:hypothetical protein
MNRPLRKYLVNLLIVLFAGGTLILLFGDGPRPERPVRGQSITVTARPLLIPPGNVDIPTALSLKLLDAWELNSKTRSFGGLSGLQASGNSLVFMSDSGAMVRLVRGESDKNWRGTISALPSECSAGGPKKERDTESIITDPNTGAFWIGFEMRNGVCRIASPEYGGTRFYQPKPMKAWPNTGGAEAMVKLRGGSFLIFAERPLDSGPIADLLLFDRDPTDPTAKVTQMGYRPPTGYRPVDAAQLPDGRILVLNRRFQIPFAFSARLSIIDLPTSIRGKIWGGPIVARFDGDVLGENFEALAIDNDGENLTIWMATDDNYMDIQRTLLLRFIWPGAARSKRGVEGRPKAR